MEYFICKECNKKIAITRWNLKIKKTPFCNNCNIKKPKTHGLRYTRLHNVWSNMKNRCNNKNTPCYKHYGGRGINIYKNWNDSFIVFNNWALENGYQDNLTIDRINNDGNYEPSNCRWIEQKYQVRNVGLNSKNTTGYKGVIKKKNNKYYSKITVNKKTKIIGTFETALEASNAYDNYIIENNLKYYILNKDLK